MDNRNLTGRYNKAVICEIDESSMMIIVQNAHNAINRKPPLVYIAKNIDN